MANASVQGWDIKMILQSYIKMNWLRKDINRLSRLDRKRCMEVEQCAFG